MPTIGEVRPLSVFSSLKKDEKYNLFNQFIQDHLELKKKPGIKTVKLLMSMRIPNYSSIFTDLASYSDGECLLDTSLNSKVKSLYDNL